MTHSRRRAFLLGSLGALAALPLGLLDLPALAQGGPAPSLDASGEAALLRQMRDEEKLARDVYDRFAPTDPLFATLADAERRHFDAVGRLMASRGLPDPAAAAAPGAFGDPATTALYEALVARGTTPVTRFEVAAEIEETDLDDLRRALERVASPDVRAVFENLARGSRNHMRHVDARLTALGIAYAPRRLARADYDAIVRSPIERGGPGGRGRGRGGWRAR